MIGARITNPAKGTVVIDQNYSNLCLRSFERFQINGSGQYATIQKAFTSTVGVVAFAEGNVFVGNISRSGSTCTYTLAAPSDFVFIVTFSALNHLIFFSTLTLTLTQPSLLPSHSVLAIPERDEKP